MSHCMRHFEEPYVADCRNCHRPFCSRCLVFAFGPDKPPYCIGCALNASGVRNKGLVPTGAAQPKATAHARHDRASRKEERRAAKAQAKATKAAAKAEPAIAEAARTSNVPAPAHMAIPSARYAPHAPPPSERPVG